MAALLLANALLIAVFLTVAWLLATWRRDVSWIDPCWPAGFVLVAWHSALWHSPANSGHIPAAALVMVSLVTLWGLRLNIYLTARKLEHAGEDYRYAAMRQQGGPGFWYRSLLTIFYLQGALLWVISLPVQLAIFRAGSYWNLLGWLGIALWLIGFACEAIGDHQLRQFRRDANNRGRVLQTGLWRYSRHPNYFGEACAWWGIYLLAVGIDRSLAWTVISPVLITWLLLKISGVSLLEKTITDRRPQYAEYIRRTSPFVPWFPKQ